jgi:hypothetical protein
MVSFFSRKPATYAPFKGKQVNVSTGRSGFTVRGPVPNEYVIAAKGNTDPNFWNPVIAKWDAKPVYQKKDTSNLYKLIEKETESYEKKRAKAWGGQRPEVKTIVREVKRDLPVKKAPEPKAEAPEAPTEPVKPPVLSMKVPAGVRIATKSPTREFTIKDRFRPMSESTSKALETRDISGKKYSKSPQQVARDMNLTNDVQKRYMAVLSGRMDFQQLPALEKSRYDSFRNKVRAGGRQLRSGEGSFGG